MKVLQNIQSACAANTCESQEESYQKGNPASPNDTPEKSAGLRLQQTICPLRTALELSELGLKVKGFGVKFLSSKTIEEIK